ncbi:conserved uncharacterized protein [Elysia marginata]|uniref:Conserved uncharacterized protein n=1 Tax=Elysia marginata TaxID=1093978 RepID=A0AAV4FLT8_9GAST|nr:conserved uncharacterized protein [Elysia marginata]
MSTVCGRTRVMTCLSLMLCLLLCLLLWVSYLYSTEFAQSDSSIFRVEGNRRYKSLFKRDGEAERYHAYRHLDLNNGKVSDVNFSPIRGRLGRHAYSGKKRAAHLPTWLQQTRVWRPNQIGNRKRFIVEEEKGDGRSGFYEEPAKKIKHFSIDAEREDNGMELNGKDGENGDLDLLKEAASIIQRKKLMRQASIPYARSKYKPKDFRNQNRQVNNGKKKPAKDKSYTMSSMGIKGLPDFSVEHIQRRTSSQVKIDESLFHEKWIVVTSILQPTPDVMFLSKIPGWKVLVVGDTKTPGNWSYPNCVFLNIADQETLGLSLAELTPYRSYARKNLGYLFAVAHGANVIYETDDDNRPLDMLKSFQLAPSMSGLMFAGEELFNPYHHFGQLTLWPRGYPLGAVGSTQPQLYRLSSKWKTPAVQQGVVNGDPDMDAIFRLTRKQTTSRLQVNFDPTGPPVIIPEGVYSPFNSQNTLFRYEALWAMLLPTTTTFRMCDIWRGYWAQRLLWEIGARLAFFPPNAYQQRNAHSYMDDARDEQDMYFETDRLLKFLSNWACPQDLTFFQCVYLLSFEMAEQNFWKAGDIEVTKLWLEDLVRVGYRQPKRVHVSNKTVYAKKRVDSSSHLTENKFRHFLKANKLQRAGSHDLTARRLSTLRNGTSVHFAASQQSPPSVYSKNSLRMSHASHLAQDIASLCSQSTNISVKMDAIRDREKVYFDDILLVVVFNWPHYANVKYLETIYRNVFPNIAYCGGNSDMFLAQTKELDIDLTFINAPVLIGVYGYACFIAAAQMGYNVTGYMVVGDDVLVNMWNFHGFDKERIWSNFAVHIFNVNNGTNWSWWNFQVGEQAYNKSMAAIMRQKEREDPHQENAHIDRKKIQQPQRYGNSRRVKSAKAFLSTLHSNTGGPANCPHAVSDVYYIPASLAPSAVHYMSLFAQQGLMVELAISMTLYGLSLSENIQFFSGDNLWLGERLDPWRKFNPLSFFLHPVKFSNTSNVEPLCSKYLPALIQKVYQFNSDTIKENVTSHNARKAYIEKLQKIYRERQHLQKTWLQQELLAMKKRKEQNKVQSQSQLKKEKVSNHEKAKQVLPHEKKDPQQVGPKITDSKDESIDETPLVLKRDETNQHESSNHLPMQETENVQKKYEEYAFGTETESEETENLSEQGRSGISKLKDEQYGQHQNTHDEPDENDVSVLHNAGMQQRDKTRYAQSQRRLPHEDIDQDAEEFPTDTGVDEGLNQPEETFRNDVDSDDPVRPRHALARKMRLRTVKNPNDFANAKIHLRHQVRDEY